MKKEMTKEKYSKSPLMGAICGDIIGSYYEFNKTKDKNFEMFRGWSTFTDDTVMSMAVAKWLLMRHETPVTEQNAEVLGTNGLVHCMQRFGRAYPKRGYGGRFRFWLLSQNPQPYNSFGNGSAMRVSSTAVVASSLNEALELAGLSAAVTHNHPEGIKGAKAVASAIYMAHEGKSKQEIKEYIEKEFGYNLHRTLAEIAPTYEFEVSCQKSVPEAIICYLEANSYEETVRNAVSLGGDADTQAAIAGSIAAATPGMEIPEEIVDKALARLDSDLASQLEKFLEVFG